MILSVNKDYFLNITAFLDGAPWHLLETYRRLRNVHWQDHRPYDVGNENLWNVGYYVPDYKPQSSRSNNSRRLVNVKSDHSMS
jgi:hypothetical protein